MVVVAAKPVYSCLPFTNTHLFVDVSISVDIVKVEGPLQLLSDGASEQDGQGCHKVLMETGRTE